MRTHRIAIVIKPETLRKLDELSKKKEVKRATYVSDIVEEFVLIQGLYDKVLDKDLKKVSIDDLVGERLENIELVIDDDNIVKNLVFDPGKGILSGRSELTVYPYRPWYKRVFDCFFGG